MVNGTQLATPVRGGYAEGCPDSSWDALETLVKMSIELILLVIDSDSVY